MYSKYEKHFNKIYKKSKVRYRTFPHHIEIVKHWAEKLCDLHPEADRDAVMIAVFFHDIGHFMNPKNLDHAVVSEKEVLRFLRKKKMPQDSVEKIAHAVRSHRNYDITPKTIEAKIVTFADSASHLTTDDVYINLAARYDAQKALDKLDRDFRDLDFFPEQKKELEKLYQGWKTVLNNFPKDFFHYIQDN